MQFDFKPVIFGELIQLKPLHEVDYDPLFNAANDPLIWEQHPDNERYKAERFKIFFNDALASDSALIVLENKSNSVIGTSRYHGLDENKSEIEIGWTFLARDYWGGAYNRELKKLMLIHAFNFIDNVIFYIGKNNIRSQRAAEKIGAVLMESSINQNDLENVVYKLSKNDYLF